MAETADQTMARAVFNEFRERNYPNLSNDTAFELFASSLVLRRHDVTSSELESGIVGNSDDGGIDGFHIIINQNEAVTSDSPYLSRRKNALKGLTPNVPIDVHIIQAKDESSWDSNVLPKLQSVLSDALDTSKRASQLRNFPLNSDVVEAILTLRKLRDKTAQLVPHISFRVSYVCLAPERNLTPYFQTKRRQLKQSLSDLLPSSATVDVNYYGAAGIIELEKVTREYSAELKFNRNPSRVASSLVGLVTVNEYLKFLRDPRSKRLRPELFAANVRDYAGSSIRVNNAISQTLEENGTTKFWWLNNGITLVVDSATDPIENKWIFTNPLIVNGLQTSHVIDEVARQDRLAKGRARDLVLVRVITAPTAEVRENIIAGTNNQTSVTGLQLHANDEKLVRIEQYLRASSWHFERRRHQFRGQKLPAARVKNVVDVAQAIMAHRLLAPDTARARPTDMLTKSKSGWDSIFGDDVPEEAYLMALDFTARVNQYLDTDSARAISDEIANTRYYVVSGAALLASRVRSIDAYLKLPAHALPKTVDAATLRTVHEKLTVVVEELDDGSKSRDRIFKSGALRERFFASLL